mmetsp:Transcript_10303/g.27964  ORF Transcript_10303/g.27964 Transcript_10303/m.27964 type:complete len:225 (+) Transcript_10303:1387-2061(+)
MHAMAVMLSSYPSPQRALEASLTFCFTASSSSGSRSRARAKSLSSLSDALSLVMTASFAPVRKNRLGIWKMAAARASSMTWSLSTATKVLSHLVAPHSTRLSLSKGVLMAPKGNSLWYFMYSTTFAMVAFFSGNSIGSSRPLANARLLTHLDMQAASASTSKMSPSLLLTFTVSPLSSTGHWSTGEYWILPYTANRSPDIGPSRVQESYPLQSPWQTAPLSRAA